MQPLTGEIFYHDNLEELERTEERLNEKLVPLTSKQHKILKPLSRRRRKFLMKHGTCPCGSRKSFKKCCCK